MNARVFIIAAALLAAACATPTPYAPAGGAAGDFGYSERQIESNRFRVSFAGNSLTDLETVETFLLFRAAELTLQRGGDWFAVVDRDTERNTRVSGRSAFGPYYGGFSRRYFHPSFGWRYWHDPFFYGHSNDFYVREITRYEASAEILIGRGPRLADNPNVYDAREVRANLANAIAAAPAP